MTATLCVSVNPAAEQETPSVTEDEVDRKLLKQVVTSFTDIRGGYVALHGQLGIVRSLLTASEILSHFCNG